MRLFRFLLFVLPLFSAAQTAHADARDVLRQRAAKKACLSGDYAQGVAVLAELFVDSSDPMYIFNQGRCFEQNGRYEEAVTRFREYQRKLADAGGARDPESDRHIAECLSIIEKSKPPTPPKPAIARAWPSDMAPDIKPSLMASGKAKSRKVFEA